MPRFPVWVMLLPLSNMAAPAHTRSGPGEISTSPLTSSLEGRRKQPLFGYGESLNPENDQTKIDSIGREKKPVVLRRGGSSHLRKDNREVSSGYILVSRRIRQNCGCSALARVWHSSQSLRPKLLL